MAAKRAPSLGRLVDLLGAAKTRRSGLASAGALLGALLAAILGAIFGALLPVTSAWAVQAPEIAKSDYTEVSLVADKNVLTPGGRFTIALHQKIAPQYHTYWENYGEVGAETKILWEAPEGVEIGPIQWPTPLRIATGSFVNFGYEDEAILLMEVRLPEDWPVGRPLELGAKARWLVCKDSCFPEQQRYSLRFPVAERAKTDFRASLLIARGRGSLPPDAGEIGRYRLDGERLTLTVNAPKFSAEGVEELFFFPRNWRVAKPSAPQIVEHGESGPELTIEIREPGFSSPIAGVLTAKSPGPGGGGERIAIALAALGEGGGADAGADAAAGGAVGAAGLSPPSQTSPPQTSPPQTSPPQISPPQTSPPQTSPPPPGSESAPGSGPSVFAADGDLGLGLGVGLGAAALLAFLGGAILNLLPCVFPILALKALSIVRSAHDGPAASATGAGRYHGMAYGAGVLASFLAFAAVLVVLKALGVFAGLGAQLQTPIIVAMLAYLLVLIGLNLAGVFEISVAFAGVGEQWTRRNGWVGDFFTGVLAVVVAAPCVGPFLGLALGYSMTQDAVTTFAVFAALGLGFALPMVLLSRSPAVARLVPRPGPWMERFRQVLAFPMFLTAAALFWILGRLAGNDALFAALAGAVALSFAAWVWGAGRPQSVSGRRIAAAAALAALVSAVWALSPSVSPTASAGSAARIASAVGGVEAYHPSRLAAHQAEGRTVFLNVTADWCISCKWNEVNVLSGDRFEQALKDADAVYVKGDWTDGDDVVTTLLQRFGRIGVPLYVVFPSGGGDPIVLPQLLTHGLLADALGVK